MTHEETLEKVINEQSKLIDEMMAYMADNPNGEAGRLMVYKIGDCVTNCRDYLGAPTKAPYDTYNDIVEDYQLQVKAQEGLS